MNDKKNMALTYNLADWSVGTCQLSGIKLYWFIVLALIQVFFVVGNDLKAVEPRTSSSMGEPWRGECRSSIFYQTVKFADAILPVWRFWVFRPDSSLPTRGRSDGSMVTPAMLWLGNATDGGLKTCRHRFLGRYGGRSVWKGKTRWRKFFFFFLFTRNVFSCYSTFAPVPHDWWIDGKIVEWIIWSSRRKLCSCLLLPLIQPRQNQQGKKKEI